MVGLAILVEIEDDKKTSSEKQENKEGAIEPFTSFASSAHLVSESTAHLDHLAERYHLPFYLPTASTLLQPAFPSFPRLRAPSSAAAVSKPSDGSLVHLDSRRARDGKAARTASLPQLLRRQGLHRPRPAHPQRGVSMPFLAFAVARASRRALGGGC